MKLVFTDAGTVTQGDLSLDCLRSYGDLILYDENTEGEEQLLRIEEADALFCNKTKIGRKEIDRAKNLRYIGLFATGYNNIDIAYAKEKGITVCNAGQYSTKAVAQQTFALLLELVCQTGKYHRFVEDGGWQKSRFFSIFTYPTEELAEKVMGIVGYGSIGQATAQIAAAFGMKVLVFTRTPKADPLVEFVSFEELLQRADVISLHTPLNEQTAKMMNRNAFSSMKKGSILINTSRGGVVDEIALREALDSGHLAGAGLDVLEKEPQAPDCPLIGAKNIIITPHVAWAPLETRLRLLSIVEDNFRSYLAGHPKNQVNP